MPGAPGPSQRTGGAADARREGGLQLQTEGHGEQAEEHHVEV